MNSTLLEIIANGNLALSKNLASTQIRSPRNNDDLGPLENYGIVIRLSSEVVNLPSLEIQIRPS